MAASLIAVIGDPDSVDALVEAFRRFPGSNILQTLLECGPQGRQSLGGLVFDESFLVSDKAWDALLMGLHRPAIRPAIFRILQQLAENENAAMNYRFGSAQRLVALGWLSSWRGLEPLLGAPIVDNLFEGEVSARFPASRSPLQEIAGPCLAQIRSNFMQQLEAEAQRTRDFTQLYESEIEKRRGADRPFRASVGRNEPCPCRSGKKYKRCCLSKEQERGRADPWVLAHDQLDWSPVGLQSLPMETADSPRVLQILLENKPGRLKIDPQDTAVTAWLLATRWLQTGDWPRAVDALRFALQAAQPEGLDFGATLTTLIARVQLEGDWDRVDTILEIWGERALDSHFWILGEALAQNDERLLSLVDCLVSRRVPLNQLLALAEGALQSGADWILAEELSELLKLHYSQEARCAQATEELLEKIPLRPGYEQAFPYPHPRWIDSLPHLQRCQNLPLESLPEAEHLLFRLEQLSVWPDANATVTEDSLEPLSGEFEARRQLQAQTLDQLYQLFSQHQEKTLAALLIDSSLVVALTPEEVIWFVPPLATLHNTSEIANAAEALTSQLSLGNVEVRSWQGRFVLRQPYQDCHPQEVAKKLPPFLSQLPETNSFSWKLLPLGSPFFENSGVTFSDEQNPFQLGKAAAPDHPAQLEAGLPVAIEKDPNPVRKALRKALRRLFRLNQVGGSHSAEELSSRGIRAPLRDPVGRCLELLVQRGVLQERLTLTGPQTLIDFRQTHKVLSFVEQGWLPHPDLADLLSGWA